MLREYKRGKVNISFGNSIVTGLDTSWLTYCKAGDTLHIGDQSMEILTVTAHAALVLTETWVGTSGNDLPYRIEIAHNSITRVKDAMLEWVHRERSLRCVVDVIAHDRPWQADLTSQDLVTKAITLATIGAPLPVAWRDTNNSDMPITSIGQLALIGGAMAQQTEAVYHRSWQLKAAIDAAATVEELNLIEWETEPPP